MSPRANNKVFVSYRYLCWSGGYHYIIAELQRLIVGKIYGAVRRSKERQDVDLKHKTHSHPLYLRRW